MKERERAREIEGWGREETGLVVGGGEVEELIEKMGVRGADGGIMSRSLVVGWLREMDMVLILLPSFPTPFLVSDFPQKTQIPRLLILPLLIPFLSSLLLIN